MKLNKIKNTTYKLNSPIRDVKMRKNSIVYITASADGFDYIKRNISSKLYVQTTIVIGSSNEYSKKAIVAIKQAEFIFTDNYYPILGYEAFTGKRIVYCPLALIELNKIFYTDLTSKKSIRNMEVFLNNITDVSVGNEEMKNFYNLKFTNDNLTIWENGLPRLDAYFSSAMLRKIDSIQFNYESLLLKKQLLYVTTNNQITNPEEDINYLCDKYSDSYDILYCSTSPLTVNSIATPINRDLISAFLKIATVVITDCNMYGLDTLLLDAKLCVIASGDSNIDQMLVNNKVSVINTIEQFDITELQSRSSRLVDYCKSASSRQLVIDILNPETYKKEQ